MVKENIFFKYYVKISIKRFQVLWSWLVKFKFRSTILVLFPDIFLSTVGNFFKDVLLLWQLVHDWQYVWSQVEAVNKVMHPWKCCPKLTSKISVTKVTRVNHQNKNFVNHENQTWKVLLISAMKALVVLLCKTFLSLAQNKGNESENSYQKLKWSL